MAIARVWPQTERVERLGEEAAGRRSQDLNDDLLVRQTEISQPLQISFADGGGVIDDLFGQIHYRCIDLDQLGGSLV